MNNNQHIDQFIRDKVQDFKAQFDEKNWDKMAAKLSKAKPAGINSLTKKIMVAATVLAIIISSTWWINYCSNSPSPGTAITENHVTDNKTTVDEKPAFAEINKSILPGKSSETGSILPKQSEVAPATKNKINAPEKQDDLAKIEHNHQIPSGLSLNGKADVTRPNQLNEVNQLLLDTDYVLVNFQANEMIDTLSSVEKTDSGEIAGNLPAEDEPSEPKKKKRIIKIDPKWNAGAYIGSDFYVLSNTSSVEGYSISDKNPFQLSPGMIFSRHLGRVYQFSVGVFYISKQYRVNYNGIANPVSSEIPTYSDYQFSFLEIPVTGSYDYLITDFLSLYLSAGLINQIMISDKITTTYSSAVTGSNPFSDVKKYNISMLVNTGMNYRLNKSLQLDFQPSVRVNLKSGLLSGTNPKHDIIEVRKIFPGGYVGLKYIF